MRQEMGPGRRGRSSWHFDLSSDSQLQACRPILIAGGLLVNLLRVARELQVREVSYSGGMVGSIQKCNTPFDERSAHRIRQDCLKFIVVAADNTN
jgi:hypothetical protein